MPFLPAEALPEAWRRLRGGSSSSSLQDEASASTKSRQRRTRGVTLAPGPAQYDEAVAPDKSDQLVSGAVLRSKSCDAGVAQHATRARQDDSSLKGSLRRPWAPQMLAATPRAVTSRTAVGASPIPVSPLAVSPRLVTPVAGQHRVTFAPSPLNQVGDVTPYGQVYGVHPHFFDFDQQGRMQPTLLGYNEMQRGTLRAFTPSHKALKALVVAGNPNSSPTGAGSPAAFWPVSPAAQQASQPTMPFAQWERVMVLTDDGLHWMEGQVIAAFPVETETEGYSVPGGTVKVSYEMGVKWVMPQNINKTLRKKASTTTGAYPGTPISRTAIPGMPMQHPGLQAQQHSYAGFQLTTASMPGSSQVFYTQSR